MNRQTVERGHLQVRPGMVSEEAPAGLHSLGSGRARDGALYVPKGYDPAQPAPFVLMLHGAGGNGRNAMMPFLPLADRRGTVLLAPDSRGDTWDVIRGGYGPDVAFIEESLEAVFSRYAVDPSHLAIEGFSDGASYALSLGLTNGDLFTHIIAFSPGFMAPAEQRGEPQIFMSHGTDDRVLPIDRCSRRIAPQLEAAGYNGTYIEFRGGHSVPEEIATDAMNWFLGELTSEPLPEI